MEREEKGEKRRGVREKEEMESKGSSWTVHYLQHFLWMLMIAAAGQFQLTFICVSVSVDIDMCFCSECTNNRLSTESV